MRIVFDTNIFIAAALKGEFAFKIITLADKELITLLTSQAILTELKQKLLSKFDKSEETVLFFIDKIRKIAHVIEEKEKISVIIRDPDDNKILECAVSGKADLIVSSDQDLISIKEFRGIAIIHPKTLSYIFPKYFKKERERV